MPLTNHGRFIVNYSLNFLSAVLLIYLSKWIVRRYALSSMILTIFNCLFSGILATIILRFLSKPTANLPISLNRSRVFLRMLLISGSFAAFITFSNLSLQYNTIGTYQLIKLQVPPTLMLIEWIQLRLRINPSIFTEEKFSRDYSFSVLLTFTIIVFGTLVNTYSDLYFHPLGVSCACISVICNALYQALVQGDKASSNYERTRFLQIQSITSAFILLPSWPLLETSVDVKWHLFSRWEILSLVFLCGFLAFLVNSSVIWCIKDDAAIEYNMVGQLKTLLIVFVGSALFDELLTVKQNISILVTTAGCLSYVYITYRTKERQKAQPLLPNS